MFSCSLVCSHLIVHLGNKVPIVKIDTIHNRNLSFLEGRMIALEASISRNVEENDILRICMKWMKVSTNSKGWNDCNSPHA